MTEIKKLIDEILIPNALRKVLNAYNHRDDCATTETYIIFPKKRDGTDRVSEQEFRFAFIEALTEYNKDAGDCDKIYYSVETPSKDVYRFPKDNMPIIAENDEGQSASFDLTLYRNKRVIALIEFKAHNVNKLYVWKDLLKLKNPKEGNSECFRYFLWLFESKNSGTGKSVNDKIIEGFDKIEGFGKMDCVVRCRCYALSDLKGDKFPEPFYRYPEESNK
jgi:hypothetical protein